ncbi:M42 family metallopeptidase [Helcococcus kunzii]|uniref:M42 family metallopeptidase n=1 Tax=Helcococcus kunzii TaxID=40091 RepID=UPI001BB0520B|nr:M42 family metallopeptidase [Helcococcus kunzii]QUY65205.1 M42 family metallopeptidase [Helcococcus kunzii]QZO75865.1 M42 family metallopeptidase [Helcococcus kunzii]
MDLDLLNRLSSINGVSSFEKSVSDLIEKEVSNYFYDGIGSIIAYDDKKKDENAIKLMFATHMDEVGFIVESIEDNFLKLRMLGSLWPHLVVGQLYTLTTRDNKQYLGVISSPSSHNMIDPKEREKTIPKDKMYLDLGMDAEEIKRANIQIGDMVTPVSQFSELGFGKTLLNKAFDDRVSCFVGLETLKKDIKSDCELYWAFTVQEEPGLRGARTSTHMIEPDIGIAIDTTVAGDTPFDENIVKLGGGVVLSFIDSNSIAHRGLMRWIEDLCENNGIKYQYAVFNRGGTDSGNIHKTLKGVVNLSLSIPIRYMHTNHSIVHKSDIEECIKLVELIIKNTNRESFNKIVEG